MLTKHGTGICVMSLYMADRASDGRWYLYEFLEEDFNSQLEKHYTVASDEKGIRLVLDGEKVGLPAKIDAERAAKNYQYTTGNQIDFVYEGDKIVLKSELAGYAEGEISVNGDYSGHEIVADVLYHGNGVWELGDCRYEDTTLEGAADTIIRSYYQISETYYGS